jgi:hypothetical protein
MIDRNHRLALTKQAALLGTSRGSVYCEPAPVSDADLALMRRLDELHLEFPFAGARTQVALIRRGECDPAVRLDCERDADVRPTCPKPREPTARTPSGDSSGRRGDFSAL